MTVITEEPHLAEEHLQDEAASPFLPGTKLQFAWDSTSLGWLKQCPRLYQYMMIEGWRPKDESIHLRFGIEYHHSLEYYDVLRAGDLDHDAALREVVRDALTRTYGWNPTEEEYGRPAKYKNRFALVRAVIWYLDKFSEEKDPAETYHLDSGEAAVELSFKIEMDFGPEVSVDQGGVIPDGGGGQMDYIEPHQTQPYMLCGHLDRVVNFNGDLYTMDRKTSTSQLGDYYFEQFSPHNQMTIYTFAGQVIMKAPVKGVIIDGAQLLIDGARFKRGFTFRNKEQINEWLLDLKITLMENEGYVDADYWPKRDTSCNHYFSQAAEGTRFGGCPFRDVCNKPERLRPNYLKSSFTQEDRWNPLKPR